MTDDQPPRPWRVGRSLGRTLYEQAGDEASKDDTLLGLVETRELAAQIVMAINNATAFQQAIELVLLNHKDELDDSHGKVDPDLAELAYVYEQVTGWTVAEESGP